MIYCVNVREKKTGNKIETVLETESHDEAYTAINEYNKEYGIFAELLKQYPKDKYFVDIHNDRIR